MYVYVHTLDMNILRYEYVFVFMVITVFTVTLYAISFAGNLVCLDISLPERRRRLGDLLVCMDWHIMSCIKFTCSKHRLFYFCCICLPHLEDGFEQ